MMPVAAAPSAARRRRLAPPVAPLLALLVAGLAACSQPEVPPDQFYRLAVTTPEAAAVAPRLPGTLVVERPDAEGLLTGRPIVYTTSAPSAALLEHRYDFWEKAPALLVRDALVGCLDRAGMARRVVTEQTRVDAEFAVLGRLVRFERIEATPPRVAVEMQLGLRDTRSRDLLLWTTYTDERPARDDSMTASIAAFDEAVSEICRQLIADLARVSPPATGDRQRQREM
jgi:ABC-type uncharacterized transport system auxiliary subunit